MSRDLYKPSTIKETTKRHKFKFSKSLGQNFLTDFNIINEIIQGAMIEEGDLIIEIGPGSGILTEQLCKTAKKVVAIEIDQRLIPILEESFEDKENIEIINGDVLKIDLQEIIDKEKTKENYKSVKIIGNLPYYITTPIIMGILENGITVDSITIMMQKEVADRILAEPKTKEYGALSVAVQYYCDVTKIASAPKEVFIPKPKVDSEVVRLDVKKESRLDVKDIDRFFEVVKAGFGMRRKTLLNSLTLIDGINKEQIKKALESANIDSSRRAETLTIDEFAKLADEIQKISPKLQK